MEPDALDDARLCIEGANEKITQFKSLLKTFLGREAWSQRVDFDTERKAYIHKLILGRQPGRQIKKAAKDAWSDLRSALDHLNAACARLGGATRNRGHQFPFAPSAAELDAMIRARCRLVPEPVKDYFKSLRPYKGGDERLYALTTVRNSNEHWKMREAILTTGAVQVVWPKTRERKLIQVSSPPRAMNEVELFRCAYPATDYFLEICLNIAFEDFEAFGTCAAETALEIQSRKVTEICDETESILRGLGLLT